MNENAVKIQIIMNHLGEINVPATNGNAERLAVIWQLLNQVLGSLAAAQATEGTEDGKADTE